MSKRLGTIRVRFNVRMSDYTFFGARKWLVGGQRSPDYHTVTSAWPEFAQITQNLIQNSNINELPVFFNKKLNCHFVFSIRFEFIILIRFEFRTVMFNNTSKLLTKFIIASRLWSLGILDYNLFLLLL